MKVPVELAATESSQDTRERRHKYVARLLADKSNTRGRLADRLAGMFVIVEEMIADPSLMDEARSTLVRNLGATAVIETSKRMLAEEELKDAPRQAGRKAVAARETKRARLRKYACELADEGDFDSYAAAAGGIISRVNALAKQMGLEPFSITQAPKTIGGWLKAGGWKPRR